MPRYLRPNTALPADVAMAIESFGTIFSRSIVRYLVLHGPASSVEIAKEFNTDPNTVRRALQQLEKAEVVTADQPIGQRRGRRVLFQVRQDQVEHLVKSLHDFLLGH